MNEHFAVEPNACESAAELRHLLERFGPYCGRYIASFPPSWLKAVLEATSAWSELERARAVTVLQRAQERFAVIRRRDLNFDTSKNWLQNLRTIQDNMKPFAGAIVARENRDERFPSVDTLELSPTSDEVIDAVPEEFGRVSSTLLLVSPEVSIIDPFLDPTRRDRSAVLEALLKAARGGRCGLVTMFARHAEMFSPTGVERELKRLLSRSGGPVKQLRMVLVDDGRSAEKLHARYLLSVRGALRFDQGFQELTRGRKMDVSVVGEKVHKSLVERFLEGGHGLNVVSEIRVT